MKTNRLAIISFGLGIIVLLSLFLYWVLFKTAYPSNLDQTLVSENRALLAIMDLSVALRNFCAPAALILGILALRENKKNAGSKKDRIFAWIGIALGAGWLIVGLLVGLTFLLAAKSGLSLIQAIPLADIVLSQLTV